MRKCIVSLLFLLFFSSAVFAEISLTPVAPYNSRILSYNGSEHYLYITVVDLDTNEVVIIYIDRNVIKNVIHTGMYLNIPQNGSDEKILNLPQQTNEVPLTLPMVQNVPLPNVVEPVKNKVNSKN